jgi:D-xylose transport system substrate-binding protein
MARRRTLMTALAASLVFGLAACGGGDDSGSGGGGGGGGGEAAGKIGVILPDTESSPRWESFDRPLLEAAFEDAGIEYEIDNAQGDAQRMATIADQMITSGVTVLAIVNLDNASGAQIQERAAEQGVATIDYDRLTLGGSAEYYVSFDNAQVGRLQGQGLADCLGDVEANIAYLNGSPDDSNATLFSEGAHEVLDAIDTYTNVAEQAVPGWEPDVAATIFEQMYTQTGGDIQGVYAANDTLANAAIQTLSRNNQTIPVTGQDASLEGLQNILAGRQCMTVFKPASEEANALAELAIALIEGDEDPSVINGEVEDTEGGRQVPSVLLDPVSITRENVSDVTENGQVEAADLCTGEYAAACTELGIQ